MYTALAYFASWLLRRDLPAEQRSRLRRWIAANGGKAHAEYRTAWLPQLDLPGKVLYRITGAVVTLYRALENVTASPDDAVRLTGVVFNKTALTLAPKLMAKPGTGPGAFERFKRIYDKANKPLTLMTGERVESTPDYYYWRFNTCGVAEMTRRVGYPQVGRVFCAFDDAFFERYDPRVKLERTKTIARGDDECDFRFRWAG